MNPAGWYLVYPLLFLISLLPLPVLYLIADLIAFMMRVIFRYRREVIIMNLKNSFPEKSVEWLNHTANEYYSHMADIMIETVKLISISRKNLDRRVTYTNMEVFAQRFESGKSVLMVMGHTGNWEWAGAAMGIKSPYHLYFIYRPVKSRVFDRLFLRLRSRFGPEPVPMQSIFRKLSRPPETPTATAFLADQSPPPESACWINFLNQDTPVFRGVEKLALRTRQDVLFANIYQTGRGRYSVHVTPIETSDAPCALTGAHTKLLEKAILERPVNWLWSHRRWKHKRQTGN